ncbi:AMP-binding protein [Tenacibaculum sp. S7007]|uniref:AMP-binding protein n=1 Tax=Tenacibaculum pelagium TaxID=2759527 RepID=A0A839ALW0_9FLAO|nr:AMP-binding protein [Tenacibaculum pelagium]MBA6155360.1 AMP-binding protein [Tenacibaculum pelagium]
MKSNSFHKSFKLNDTSFTTKEELLSFSKEINESIFSFLSDWFKEDYYVIVQTSGSTGKPKLIQLKKEFMINSALATGEFFNLKENTTALLCLSTDYIAGKMMLVRALTLGWRLDVVGAISNPLKDLEKHYDFSAMVPLQLSNSLSELYKLKQLIVGGGVVSNDLIDAIQNIPTKVYATYGMTETITHIAVKKLNNFSSLRGTKQSKSFYKLLPNVDISQDTRNCLVIEAPKVSGERVITNDVVKIVSKTAFEWLGRFDNVINSGGVKLHPEKIEEKLSSLISNRFFVAGVQDEVLGERLVLVVEGEQKLIDFSAIKNLTKYETPKQVYFIDEFIETETKKIQRTKTLKKCYAS